MFSGIQNELKEKVNQEYYENAVKDLTQAQRSHVIKILKGEDGPSHQDAKEIVTHLQNYKAAYDSADDKKAYISVRVLPRERSWYKSIARFFSNLGGRVSSGKVLDAITKADLSKINIPEENKIMGDWLSQFQGDFLAHAVYAKKESVLQDGVLKPAEMILREGKKVEFEQGSSAGSRGDVQLPKLDQKDMDDLQQALFSKENESRLQVIESKENEEILAAGKAKYKEFSALRKELHAAKPITRFAAPTLDEEKMERLRTLGAAIEDDDNEDYAKIHLYLEYATLKRKQNGLRALLTMKNKTSIEKTPPRVDDSTRSSALIYFLAKKYDCSERDILVAFDLAQPKEKQLDYYLRGKYKKEGHSQNILAELRSNVLKLQKLNQEIRISQNEIYWEYGNVVILIGGIGEDQSKVRKSLGTEMLMNSPIVSDDFYSINLKNTDNLLILGPKKDLEAFKENYGDRIVYIEDLSLAEMDTLGVPDRLRQSLSI